jgi:hypothetical protein
MLGSVFHHHNLSQLLSAAHLPAVDYWGEFFVMLRRISHHVEETANRDNLSWSLVGNVLKSTTG